MSHDEVLLFLCWLAALCSLPALFGAVYRRDWGRAGWVVIALLWMANYGMAVSK